MSTTTTQRGQLLSQWIKPSSDDEKAQQDRAQRMVTDAVKGHEPLKSAALSVYAKGSYANNTNVRRDSDVDIVVQCQVCQYFDYMPGQEPASPAGSPYVGEWAPGKLRSEVSTALAKAFGASNVDTSGKLALLIGAVPGSRPSIDVVPCFDYRLYNDPHRSSWRDGSCVWPSSGPKIVNWPAQQLNNGRSKNTRTGGRYKYFARALKNAENVLVREGTIEAKASYLMECLAWNVTDATLQTGDLSAGFRATLAELWEGLDSNGCDRWTEPNDIKYLFRAGQKWAVDDAREVVLGTWRYLGY
jgi:hypothetical protein